MRLLLAATLLHVARAHPGDAEAMTFGDDDHHETVRAHHESIRAHHEKFGPPPQALSGFFV